MFAFLSKITSLKDILVKILVFLLTIFVHTYCKQKFTNITIGNIKNDKANSCLDIV